MPHCYAFLEPYRDNKLINYIYSTYIIIYLNTYKIWKIQKDVAEHL